MHCSTAEGTTCSLIVITTNKNVGRHAGIPYGGYRYPLPNYQ
jgi:hypothetical protein